MNDHRAFLRHVEPDELVILLDQLGRFLHIPELMGQVRHLVVEDIRQPLEEDQRQDVILELGRVERPPDRAGRLPEPVLQRGDIELLRSLGLERE